MKLILLFASIISVTFMSCHGLKTNLGATSKDSSMQFDKTSSFYPFIGAWNGSGTITQNSTQNSLSYCEKVKLTIAATSDHELRLNDSFVCGHGSSKFSTGEQNFRIENDNVFFGADLVGTASMGRISIKMNKGQTAMDWELNLSSGRLTYFYQIQDQSGITSVNSELSQ